MAVDPTYRCVCTPHFVGRNCETVAAAVGGRAIWRLAKRALLSANEKLGYTAVTAQNISMLQYVAPVHCGGGGGGDDCSLARLRVQINYAEGSAPSTKNRSVR